MQNPTVVALTERLVPVFKTVLGEPEEQLDDETRLLVTQMVQTLQQLQPNLFA
jgi:importin-4